MESKQGFLPHQRTLLASAVAKTQASIPDAMGLCLLYGTLLTLGAGSAIAADAPATGKRDTDSLEVAEFNPSFFDHGGSVPTVDVKRFEQGTPVEPGLYRLDVYVNDSWVGRMPIRAVAKGKDEPASYCIKASQFAEMGVDVTKLPPANQMLVVGDCVSVRAAVPDGTLSVDLSDLTAHVSIPQAYLGRKVQGYVDPADWDSGVTAGFVMYDANAYDNDYNGSNTTNYYAGLNAGLNVGEWRLRHNGNYNRSEGDGSKTQSKYTSISSYAQRDITNLKSQLTAGQYYTDSAVFDSVPYTGVQLASDDRMLPDSQRGFAPVIRGVADTNAKVRVKQGQNILYETTVAPGPFEINDLYNTGYAGDLTVEITEADGRVKSFLVPYASINQLVRPGVTRYSLTAGKYRNDQLDREPNFAQGTYQYGVNNYMTAYTGGIVAEDYISGQAGLAFSTPFGALASDVTQSSAKNLDDHQYGVKSSMNGQSYRVTYSKLLQATGTNMTIAAYRFNSEGYLSFTDFAQAWGTRNDSTNDYSGYRQRNRYQLSVNQPIGQRSSLYFTGSKQNYWNRSSGDSSFQAGFNTGFNWGSIAIGASRTRNQNGDFENAYMLNVNVPIGMERKHPLMLSHNVNFTNGKNNTIQTTLSGTSGDNNELSYSVYGSGNKNDGDRQFSGGGNVNYSLPQTMLNANFSNGQDYKQIGVGARGSLVAHAGGINFSQNQSETMAIVEAKGAEGAAVNSNVGAKVTGNGYTVVGGLTPYRQNEITLDPKGTSKDVELEVSSQQVAPRFGAVVLLKYDTVIGAPILMQVSRSDGQAIPLGAEVLDGKGNSLSMVGQGGNVFLRGLQPKGELIVKWGSESGQSCQVNYQLPATEDKGAPFLKATGACQMILGKPQVAQR
ncbi:fimbria/pilus outer membrane usher protein [Pseudomonas sp. PDNC002]|uniref:fimbria/pilus outer membrane usher protein n=1 Tax=Pseudomonas sp. PDNC002 TaxID=2811422 RepID=UPI001F06F85A|nr:fimbria/pilus outer membrane usher protein [Pseudomonas sp. PDNC002]